MKGYLIYVPLEQATTPAEGHCYVDKWWTVHPDKGVVFYNSSLWATIDGEYNDPCPQCNGNEPTARHIQEKLYSECSTIKIPVIYANWARREQSRMLVESRNK